MTRSKSAQLPGFIISVNKQAIFYFYLNNLALEGKKSWVRREYNKKFKSSVGGFSPREKKLILDFRNLVLRLEAKTDSVHLADFFYRKAPWALLRKKLNNSNYTLIKKVFSGFENKWNLFWESELSKEIKPTRAAIEENIQINEDFITKTLNHLSVLFNKKKLPTTIHVFLIPLPRDITTGGGKFVPSVGCISIEASSVRAKKRRTLEMILHETAHLYFENNRYKKIISKALGELTSEVKERIKRMYGVSTVEFLLREIIATSPTISPILNSHETNPYSKLLNNMISKLKPQLDFYIEEKKAIDKIFIRELLSLIIKESQQIN